MRCIQPGVDARQAAGVYKEQGTKAVQTDLARRAFTPDIIGSDKAGIDDPLQADAGPVNLLCKQSRAQRSWPPAKSSAAGARMLLAAVAFGAANGSGTMNVAGAVIAKIRDKAKVTDVGENELPPPSARGVFSPG